MADRERKARLLHVETLVYGTPLAVSRERLDTILAVLERRAGEDIDAAAPDVTARPDAPETTITADGVAVLPVMGTFVKRAGMMDAMSGLQSYGAVEREFRALIANPSVRGVLLQVDSPGGQVNGMLDLARVIRSAGQAKPVWAIADDAALSAAYALASGASRVLVTESGWVGSIGTIAARRDHSAADAQSGQRVEFFTSGAHKTDGNPAVPLTDPERKRLQAKVDQMGALFHELVATHRGMAVDAVRDLEAGAFIGAKAVEAGLADSVATLPEAIAALTEFVTKRPSGLRAHAQSTTAGRMEGTMAEQVQDPTPVVANIADHPDFKAFEAQVRETADTEMAARVDEITTLCVLAGAPEKVADFMKAKTAIADIRAWARSQRASTATPVPTGHRGTEAGLTARPAGFAMTSDEVFAKRKAELDEARAHNPVVQRLLARGA
jgi:signal peptide peptidase SppA